MDIRAVPDGIFAVGCAAAFLIACPAHRSEASTHRAAPAVDLTQASAAKMSTDELARRLLEPGKAEEITGHELTEPIFLGGPLRGVEFFARPEPLATDLCQRTRYYVSLKPVGGLTRENINRDVPVVKEQVSDSRQVVFAPDCRSRPSAFFAGTQLSPSFDEAAEALRRLATLQRMARAERPLPALVRCASKLPEDACGDDPRAVLARLPLDQIFIIEQPWEDQRPYWEFSVMPNGPGQAFWNVEMREPSGEPPEIRMTWMIPPPF